MRRYWQNFIQSHIPDMLLGIKFHQSLAYRKNPLISLIFLFHYTALSSKFRSVTYNTYAPVDEIFPLPCLMKKSANQFNASFSIILRYCKNIGRARRICNSADPFVCLRRHFCSAADGRPLCHCVASPLLGESPNRGITSPTPPAR